MAAEQICELREVLTERLRMALRIHIRLGSLVDGVPAGEGFDHMYQAAQHALEAVTRAQAELNRHTGSHGCQTFPRAQI